MNIENGAGDQARRASAIVTGAGSGLGAATAARLRQAGYCVTGVDISFLAPDDAPDFVQEISDVTSDSAAKAVVARHVARWGAPHALVNCAGIAAPGNTLRRDGPLPLEIFRRVMDINATGTFNYIRLAAAEMQKAEPGPDQERGVIINTSSIAAYEGMVANAAYAASKGAVSAMTLPLAREFGKFGIRVMAIAPGVFSTPMVSGMGEVSGSLVAAMRPPFPDRTGEPDEFAELVLSILNQRYLNGSVIRLDGGLRAPPR